MCLIAAVELEQIVWWIAVVLKVAVGLGAVIFVHELGHFLVAKACGVKVEKFMIGFDIAGYKLSWRGRETEYGIGILPLGGYVKMLGQDDDPAHIAEQMQKSQVSAASTDAVQIVGPNGEKYFVDRRSYLAKSVPQRMAIISAGVIMNVIFAFIFATIAYGMGVPYLPCIVSETVPGSPAWRASLEPGDEIIQIGDRVNPTFTQLRGGVTLGDLETGIPVVVRRAADGSVVQLTLKPEQNSGRLATIGIAGPQSLVLLGAIDHSPAARAALIAPAADDLQAGKPELQDRDEIIRVGDVSVADFRELAAELARQTEQPLRITVRRPLKQDDEPAKSDSDQDRSQELVFELLAQPLNRLGLVTKMGPITSVQANSPAASAGLKAGDVIDSVDGKQIGEGASQLEQWDAETLPDYLRRAASEGRAIEISVSRPTNQDQDSEPLTVQVTPRVPIMVNSPIPPRPPHTPMAANEIGIAYRVENEVIAVLPNTPAANSDLAPGDKVNAVKIILPMDKEGDTPDPIVVRFVPEEPGWLGRAIRNIIGGQEPRDPEPNWPRLVDAIQFAPDGTEVELTAQRGNDENSEPLQATLPPVSDEGAFVGARGFWFRPIERIRKAETLADQVRYGGDETIESLTMVFRFLQKLGTQVPLTALGGPVTIAKVAGYSAAEGLPTLLIFLTMLSANLAVINFLPIPLLDGGHMVFLAYEWIRGRPANEKFVVALHTAGFVFIVTLMLYVLSLDFGLIQRDL